ncbi:MAG: PorV/PorQ family protein [Bacteroidota bacterium]|nr:PorV/PorQ family protein [Bacteroidota bacterium]
MILFSVLFVQSSIAQFVPNLGGQRSGISSFQFLKIGADARGSSMSESFVAVVNDVSSVYWNPAGLTSSSSNQAIFSHAEWLVDLKYDFAAASLRLDDNNIVALSFTSLTTSPMQITTEYQPTGTGNYFNYHDIAIGGTYARKMTDQFSFGTTVRYVRETIAELHSDAILIDIGTFYYMGLGTSRFSVVVSNFGNNVRPTGSVKNGKAETVSSFQEFSPPTLFRLGYAFEPWQDDVNRLTTSIQLNHPNDNAENIRFGCEYEYDKMFFLRAGVKRTIGESFLGKSISTAEDLSFGGGVRIPLGITTANVDYAYTNFNDLGKVQRISVSITY